MTQNKNKPKKSKSKLLSRKRIRITEIGSAVICLGFCAIFGTKFGLFPYIRQEDKATRNAVTYNTIKDNVIEGDIIDRNGNLIMGNASPGSRATAAYPENYSYAYLLGYYSVSGNKENTYGLRGNLKDYSLFHLDKNNKGATTYLTTDNELQDFCWNLLDQQEGSITVIDNKTGAIRALASQSTIQYDVNDMNSLLLSTEEGSQYRRGTFETDPPGSTFKIVTAAAALTKQEKENLDDSWFDFNDTGSYYAGDSDFEITNYNHIAYGQIGLETAMNKSVNCYFANLGLRVGAEQLLETAKKFKLGQSIKIPFLCTIRSSIDIDENDPDTIAQTSFGQGKTQITPLQITMISQAIANNGKMMQPYIVDSIQSGKIPLYHHFTYPISNTMSEEVNQKLKAILHSTAVGYGISENYGMVYAKTGTAECANDRIHTYITGFTDDASFCISMNNGTLSSILAPKAIQLVNKINEVYGH